MVYMYNAAKFYSMAMHVHINYLTSTCCAHLLEVS